MPVDPSDDSATFFEVLLDFMTQHTVSLLFNQLGRRAYPDFDTLAHAALWHNPCLEVFNQRAPRALSALLMDRTAGEIEERLTAWEARPALARHVPEAVRRTFATYLSADWEGCNTKGYHALELLEGIGTKRPALLAAIPAASLQTAAGKLTDKVRFSHGAEEHLRQLAGRARQGAVVAPR